MIIVYHYNTWDDSTIHARIEEVEDGCSDLEIHAALRDYLALKGDSVREWAIDRVTSEQLLNETCEERRKRGEKLIREQND